MKKIICRIKGKIVSVLLSINPWYNQKFQDCQKFWRGFPFDLDVVNLGSSSSFYGFDYEGFPAKGANWAIRPQSFPQDFAILKTYESFLRPRAIILIALGPYSSCLKSYKDIELEKYYTILHPGVFENFSLPKCEEILAIKNAPFRFAGKEMLLSMLKFIIRNPVCLMKKTVKKILGYKDTMSYEQSAQTFINGWMHQFGISDMDAPTPIHIQEGRKKRMQVLKEMVAFCKERDFIPIIVLPPVTKELASKFSPAFRENYIYSFLREAVPEVRFLDYLEDKEYLSDHSLFRNSLFLNKKGARLFTRRVLEDLDVL